MAGLYAPYKVYTPGEVLTAADLNATDQNHITNQTPQMTDDYSQDTAQHQHQIDPATGLPTSLSGELAQLRYVLAKLGKVSTWDQITGPPTIALRGYIYGFKLSNDSGDPTNGIRVDIGTCRSDDNTADLNMNIPLTKLLSATWAVGSGQGGLDGGAKVANTWYHAFAIQRVDTENVDIIFSTSPTNPTMPVNYTKKRRIGAVRTDETNAIMKFIQVNDWFWFTNPPKDIVEDQLKNVRKDYTVLVPTGYRFVMKMNVWVDPPAAPKHIYISNPEIDDEQPPLNVAADKDNPPFAQISLAGTEEVSFQVEAVSDTNSKISLRCIGTDNTVVRSAMLAYQDPRGRDN